jgi:antitoxin VapB
MKTASLFMNGRSQAVRLPTESRFECSRVFIYRDPRTGNVVLSEKPQKTWQDFMTLRAQLGPFSNNFLVDRDQSFETRDPFSDWAE